MFTRLHLTQFKAWRDTGDVSLRPVTMLLGTNSSGKSSLIQSLLLLKQTAMSPDRTIHLNLGGDDLRDYFNFGDFPTVLTQNSGSERAFTISLDFRSRGQARVPSGSFEATYGQASSGATVIRDLSLSTGRHRFRVIRRERGAYSLLVDGENQPRGKGRHLAPERSIALPAEAISLLEKEGSVAEDLSLALRRELEAIVYLGPLRRKPERDYVWNRSAPGEIGSDGDRVIDVLLASSERNSEYHGVIEGVSKWLNRMGIAKRLEVRQTSRTRYEIMVERNGIMANLRDVGIGVSQVLPVLTVAYFSSKGNTVILEEPEIHLHPLAQSVLGEMFVEVSKERDIQFIVETHSEHLFRRIQTLIAKQKTSPAQCAMYFVEGDRRGAHLQQLEVDEFGTVRNWPKNFFGDSAGEAREQALARAHRMRERTGA